MKEKKPQSEFEILISNVFKKTGIITVLGIVSAIITNYAIIQNTGINNSDDIKELKVALKDKASQKDIEVVVKSVDAVVKSMDAVVITQAAYQKKQDTFQGDMYFMFDKVNGRLDRAFDKRFTIK